MRFPFTDVVGAMRLCTRVTQGVELDLKVSQKCSTQQLPMGNINMLTPQSIVLHRTLHLC